MNDSMEIQLELCTQLTIKPKGKSMLPFLKENRSAVIVRRPERPLKKYDIVLYKHDSVYVLHRVIKSGENVCIICGDNSNILEKVKKQDIIGVVSEILWLNKKINADNLILKLCIKIWYELGLKKIMMLCKRKVKR